MHPLLMTLALLVPLAATAGPRQDLKAGARAVDAEDWDAAARHLQAATAGADTLKDKHAAQAWCLLGRARLAADDEGAPPIEAVQALARARDLQAGRWSDRAAQRLADLAPALLLAGTRALNEAQAGDTAALATARDRLAAAAAATTAPTPIWLLAEAHRRAGDHDAAIAAWRDGLRRHDALTAPDLQAHQAAYALALTLRFGGVPTPTRLPDPEAALQVLDAALARVERDIRAIPDRHRGPYVIQRRTLTLARLDLLAQEPALRQRALTAFAAVEKAEPGNALVRVVHAGVLEAEGRLDEAEARYRDALAIDEDLVAAHLGLGSLLFQRATVLSARAAQSDDPDGAQALRTTMVSLLEQARPHLEAVVEAEPDHATALQTLAQIAGIVGDDEALKRWRARLRR